MTLLALILGAVAMDLKSTRISNRLIVLGFLLGLLFRILGNGWTGVIEFMIHISIPVIFLYLLFLMRALGAGDIKLFSVAGGFLTIQELAALIILSFLAGAVISIGKLLYLKISQKWCIGEKHFIHFSVAILIGYLIVWGCVVETNCSSGL